METGSTRPEADPARERWFRAAGLAISIVSLGAVILWAAHQPAPELPDSGAEIWALIAAISLVAANTAVRGERAQRLLLGSGAHPSRADAYGLTVVGYMGNTVLPARGGDAIRVYLQAPRARTSMRNVIGTLVAERLLDTVTLLSLFGVLAYVVLRDVDAPSGTRLAITAGALAAVALAAAALVYATRHRPAVRRALGFLAPMTVATRELRGRHGAAMLALTLVIWGLEALVYLMAGKATSLDLGALDALYIVALASVFVLIPAGPGYAGTLDAAILFGARAVGATGSEAVSYLVVLRFVLLVPITAAGLLLMVFRYGGLARLRRPRGVTA